MLLRGAEDREAVHLPHAQVGDDEIERLALERRDGLGAALGERDVVARLLQHDREEVAHAALVVDDQDTRVRHGAPAA